MSDKHVVIGVWKVLRPDIRQYKQQSIEIELSQPIAVEVPDEFIYKTVTSESGEVTDILTPAGMAYVQKQLEAIYSETVDNKPEIEQGWSDDPSPTASQVKAQKPVASDDGWSTDVTVKTEPASVKVDGWGDEPTFDSNFPPDPNLPVTETWNPDDEEWSS